MTIQQDHNRFKQIVRSHIRRNLKKYISHGEMTGQQAGKTITIPVPSINIPKFRFGDNQRNGTGQGDGEPGDPVGGQQKGEGQGGAGEAGSNEGQHVLETEISLEELAKMLGEELRLPKIENKGKRNIVSQKYNYTGISNVGPNSLRHFKRTYREALKRQIGLGTYDVSNPVVVPIRRDTRYRSYNIEEKPETNAVIIYMMDVSGSMGDEQKEIVRIESFWIDTWLRSQYNGVETRFIIHDATAKEVDRDTFFRTKESGGTLISSAYKLCLQIIEADYPQDEWNIYPFHFSDGDNWSGEDTKLCLKLLESKILPISNVFCYGQVESRYGSGQFIKDLQDHFGNSEKVITSKIADKEAIYKSIGEFLGKGK